MKKVRKSRAFAAFVDTFSGIYTEDGIRAVYYTVVPYDKKGREIPSSVQCCYNSEYYSYDDILPMTQAL
jgi:hypothetical protein